MPNSLKQLLQWLGPLRVTLVLGALAMLVLRPAPHTAAVYKGWEMVPTVLVPTFTPIIFMLLLLDAIMGAVLLASRPGNDGVTARSSSSIWRWPQWLVLWWWPFFAALGR